MANPYYNPRPRQKGIIEQFVDGFQRGLTLRSVMEENKLRALQQQRLEEDVRQQRAMAGMAEPYFKPTETLAKDPASMPGFNPSDDPEAFPHELYATQKTPPTLQSILTGLAIQRRDPDALARAVAVKGGGTSPVNSFEAGIARQLAGQNADPEAYYEASRRLGETKPQRSPSDIVNRTYHEVYRATDGDVEAAQAAAGAVKNRMAAEAAKGTATGKLDVEASPRFQETTSATAESRERGQEKVAAEKRIIGTTAASEVISRVEELSNKLLKESGGIDRFIGGVTRQAGAILQTNPDASELETLRTSYSNILSRGLLAERGVLTEQDRAYAINSIPGLYDTKEVAKRKLTRLKSLNNLVISAESELAAGRPFDVKAFRQQFNKAAYGSEKAAATNIIPDGTRQTLDGKKYIKRDGQWFPE